MQDCILTDGVYRLYLYIRGGTQVYNRMQYQTYEMYLLLNKCVVK